MNSYEKHSTPVQIEFSKGTYGGKDKHCVKIGGGTAKTNRIISNAEKMTAIEDEFMNIAFKSNRADAQREGRRAKRRS